MTDLDLELGGEDDTLDPMMAFMRSHVNPAAERLGVDAEELRSLFEQAVHQLPALKRENVWKFPNDVALHRYILKWVKRCKKQRKLLAVVGVDLRNIGGLNARYGETTVNEIIDCLLDLLIAAVKELCAGIEGSEWKLIHYGGGDEYLLLISGVDEFEPESYVDKSGIQRTRPKKTLTKALDALVRESVRWANSAGLGNTRHPKHWSTEHWGTGFFYGITFVRPQDIDVEPKKLLSNSFKICQAAKRGLRPGETNPLALPYRQQFYRFGFIFVAVFNRVFNTNFGMKSSWKRPGA